MDKRRKTRKTTELTLELDRSVVTRMLEDESGKQACLIVLEGLDVGNTIPLKREEATVLGRDPGCDGVIRDDGISRRHAEVRRLNDGSHVIVDLGSTNGIFIDGERVERANLREGQKILVGRRTILKYAVQDMLDVRFQKQMYESSVRDGLTGAFNRKHFDERIVSEVSFARRHKVPLSLVMMDLDHFKSINDNFGHPAGDQVLSTVARAVMEALRVEDVFARYGGEEFVVIARGITAVGGLALGERLRKIVEEILITGPKGDRIPVTISLGVATVEPGVSVSGAALVAAADRKLYESKENGRNRVTAGRVEEQL